MKKIIDQGIQSVTSLVDQAVEGVSCKIDIVKEKVNGLPIFISLERSAPDPSEQVFDEKHYFVIPYALSPYKFALHTMRWLPEPAIELNNLPKRRIFHFANEHVEYALKEYMIQSAKDIVYEKNRDKKNSLESLADDLDALDNKLTYGMLIVGGVAAIFNPLLGAGIAAKAVLPSMAGILNKHGLRPASKKLNKNQIEKKIIEAEKHVSKEFSSSDTLSVINPILQELDYCLRTTEDQHDPLIDPNLSSGSIAELNNSRWRLLTEAAICHVYQDVYNNPDLHNLAQLGPEDIRWLKMMYSVQK